MPRAITSKSTRRHLPPPSPSKSASTAPPSSEPRNPAAKRSCTERARSSPTSRAVRSTRPALARRGHDPLTTERGSVLYPPSRRWGERLVGKILPSTTTPSTRKTLGLLFECPKRRRPQGPNPGAFEGDFRWADSRQRAVIQLELSMPSLTDSGLISRSSTLHASKILPAGQPTRTTSSAPIHQPGGRS